MAEPLLVEVVSPEEVLYSGEADMVITRTHGRRRGRVPGRARTRSSAALVENHTRVFQTDGTVQDIAVHRGFVEVSGTPTKVSILSDTAELAAGHRRRAGQGSRWSVTSTRCATRTWTPR